VLFYDLIRMTRRTRFFVVRAAYIAALALLLYWQYAEWFGNGLAQNRPVVPKQLPVFAAQFFNRFMVLQLALVTLLTPIYAGSTIAEEKDRRTLEYLLATDLHNREIVLGKLLSRLLNLTLIIATGLPIFGVVQLLGGVDPNLVIAGFVATAFHTVSLASLGILCSVHARKPRNAILLTYLGLAAYIAAGYTMAWLVEVAYAPSSFARVAMPPSSAQLFWEKAVGFFNAGNLPWVLVEFGKMVASGIPVESILRRLVFDHAVFCFLTSGFCIYVAILRLRAAGLAHSADERRVAKSRRLGWRPGIGRWPMVWKELFIESGFRLNWFGSIAALGLVFVSLIPVGFIVAAYWDSRQILNSPWGYGPGRFPPYWAGANIRFGIGRYGWGTLGEHLHTWAAITSASVATLMLLAVAVRASTSVSGERDRDSLDALLTSPLSSHDVLFAKWLGSLASVRWVWCWIGLIWVIGILTGALHYLAPVLVVAAWVVYASAFAGIGLWYSTASKTSLRATMYTLVTCLVISGGHWVLWFCFIPIGMMKMWEIAWYQCALTPPFVLYWFSVQSREINSYQIEWEMITLLCLFGLLLWGALSLGLWTFCRGHFRRLTARYPHRRVRPRAAADSAEQQLHLH
jgi:ABC-type transport system involved in multi-copper enzyme maturation permease subunit